MNERNPNSVLIVDDEPRMRRSLSVLFEDAAYTVFTATNGVEAIAKVRVKAPSLVLTDLAMPEMDGRHLITTLKREFPLIPVIAISGVGVMHDVINAIRAGAWDYVTKPIHDTEMLLQVVDQVLERASLIRENLEYQKNIEETLTVRTHALSEREEQFRAIVESSRDALMVLDAETKRYQNPNPATLEMFGVRDEAHMAQLSPWDLSPPTQMDGRSSEDKATEMVNRALERGYNYFDWIHKSLDGTEFPAKVTLVRYHLGERLFLQCTVRDMTEQQQLEAELLQSQKMEALGRLAGGIVHDFNNILSIIIGYSDMALTEVRDTGSPLLEPLSEIRDAGFRGKQLISQLLALSRKQLLRLQRVDLNVVLTDLTRLLQRLIGDHIVLVPDLGGQSTHVMVDTGQIGQILMNLCVNARDAMPDGGSITIRTRGARHTFSGRTPGEQSPEVGCLLLEVQDTGQGIKKDILPRIFDPFYTTKAPQEGTGLGLSTVYGIVQQHHGEIFVESRPGAGTTFRIYLPLAPSGQTQEALPSQEAPRRDAGGAETVLVADDDRVVQKLALRILESRGYQVICADNGAEAVTVFQREGHRIDLLLFDVLMPKMGGYEAFCKIREINPHIPVVFSSGYSESSDLASEITSGRYAYVQKPYDVATFLTAVREALDRA